MKPVWFLMGAVMLTCCGINAGIMRDLQNEIDAINIQLTDKIDHEERAYLIGKSAGIFLAMEIIHDQGIW